MPRVAHLLTNYRATAGVSSVAPALRLCLDEGSGLPAALPRRRPLPAASRQPQLPKAGASPARTPSRTPPPPGRPSAAATPSAPQQRCGSQPAASPSTPQPGGGPTGSQTPSAGSISATAARSDAPAAMQPDQPAASADPEAEWPLRVLAGGGPRQRRLLAALAARQLAGCRFLAGNAAILPLLGRDVVFRVSSRLLQHDLSCIVSIRATLWSGW